jgi:ribose transport system substrate-binding protein
MFNRFRTTAGGAALIAGLVGTLLIALAPASASAKTFAVIPKAINDVFSAGIKEGCEKAAKDLGVECYYIGPPEVDEAKQIQVLNDILAKGVDGIAVSATNPKSMARALEKVKAKGIPVVTFDSDVLAGDAGVRAAFIGTDNYQFGIELAKKVLEYKTKGGSVCIQSGTPGSLNLDERVQGVRDTLGGGSKDKPIKRLAGESNWTEPSGCPIYNNDNIALSAQQLNDVLTSNPQLDAFVAVGGWAQYAPAAYRKAVGGVKSRVDANELIISFGDAFAPQLPLLKDHLSHYQVGQSPYQMGYKSVAALKDLTEGKTVPAYIDTGFVKCTPDMADTCGKN